MFLKRNQTTLQAAITIGVLLLALMMPRWVMAADTPPAKEFSDPVREALAGINKMMTEEPKNYYGAIEQIDKLLSQVKPETYDLAYLSQMKAQALISKQPADYIGSISYIETALNLGERYQFFEKRAQLELLWMLAQLYAQDANAEKNPDIQKQKYNKALGAVRRWLTQTTKPTYDAYYFAASLLYQQAMANTKTVITGKTTSKVPDLDLMRQAEVECQNALYMTPKPKEQIYQLLIAIAQSRNDYVTASKYLELLVETNPKNNQYWTMLLSCYLATTETMPDGSYSKTQAYAKAVYTIRRAQQSGYMIGPQDYYNLVAMYVQSNQYEGAIDILEKALREGKMDSKDYKNWDLLAQCYLQINETQKAIDVYSQASKLFSTDGNIDMQIGNLYYNMAKYAPALDAMLKAKDKGVAANKAAPLYFFIAYLYYELKEFDKALESVNKSLEINPKAQDAKDIQQAITTAIEQRNRNLNISSPAAAPQTQPTGTTAPAK